MFINTPFFISASIHCVFIGVVIFNNLYNPQIEKENFQIEIPITLTSVSELDALTSKKPKINTEKQSNLPKENFTNKTEFSLNEQKSKNLRNNFANENRLAPVKSKMEEFIKKNFSNRLPINEVILSKNDDINKKFSLKEIKGNEKNAIIIEKKFKPKPRAVDRIDDIASIKTFNEVVSLDKNVLNKDFNEKSDIKKINKKNQSIESTTKINPEGKKDAKIVVSSGAIPSSFKPLSRPKVKKKQTAKEPRTRPSAALLSKQSKSIYDNLAENFFEENNSSEVDEISTLEKQLIKNALKKAVERHWDIGILIGMSNYEKYVVKVQFMLDKRGNIYGEIKPVTPKKLGGKFAIAFRQASNALLDAQPITLPVDIENRINITMNFDPLVGLGF